jgi:Flp pilus assembly pilin Flp
MTNTLCQLWAEEDGVLSFEWTMLLTLLVIGIVGGIAAARDAIIDELGDVAQAMLALDHSMTITFPLVPLVHNESDPSSASDSSFIDALLFTDCVRNDFVPGQSVEFEVDTDS